MFFFCFKRPPTTETYTYCLTLPLPDALPISRRLPDPHEQLWAVRVCAGRVAGERAERRGQEERALVLGARGRLGLVRCTPRVGCARRTRAKIGRAHV